MPKRTIEVVEDSLDGKPLDSSVEPLRLTVDRKTWELWLSDSNRQKVLDQVAKWTLNEDPLSVTEFSKLRKTKPAAKSDPQQLAAIREWANAHGHDVAPKGRIAQAIVDEYHAAH